MHPHYTPEDCEYLGDYTYANGTTWRDEHFLSIDDAIDAADIEEALRSGHLREATYHDLVEH